MQSHGFTRRALESAGHAVQETTACNLMASLVGLWNQQGMLGDERLKARQQVLVYILQIHILLVPIAVLHSVPGQPQAVGSLACCIHRSSGLM